MPRGFLLLIFVAFSGFHAGASAQTATIRIADASGRPAAGSWVAIVSDAPSQAPAGDSVYIDQRKIAFDPLELGVPRGTRILFRNSDTVTHHVFSFSPSAPQGLEHVVRPRQETAPAVFDKPGVVRLGCNIHDQMTSHIYIAPSDKVWRADSQGLTTVDGASGTVLLEVWMPAMGLKPQRVEAVLQADATTDIQIDVSASEERESRRSRRRRY